MQAQTPTSTAPPAIVPPEPHAGELAPSPHGTTQAPQPRRALPVVTPRPAPGGPRGWHPDGLDPWIGVGGWDEPFDGGCTVVGYPDLIVGGGGGRSDEFPALVLVEETQSSGWRTPQRVEYDIAPRHSRVVYPGGQVILDFEQHGVAFLDSESATWRVETLESWAAHVDSITARARAHLWPRSPQFENTMESILIAGYDCRRHTLTVGTENADGHGETVDQEIWVTLSVATMQEIYSTYRATLKLVDRQWIDVPVSRPPGIILRTRVTRRPAGTAADAAETEDAIVLEAGHQLLPRGLFELPSGGVAGQ